MIKLESVIKKIKKSKKFGKNDETSPRPNTLNNSSYLERKRSSRFHTFRFGIGKYWYKVAFQIDCLNR